MKAKAITSNKKTDGIVVWIWFNGDMLQLRAETQDAIPGLFWRLVIYSIIRRPSIWTHALIYRYQSVPRYERSLPTSLIHAIRKKVRSCRSSSGHHQTSQYCTVWFKNEVFSCRWDLNWIWDGCWTQILCVNRLLARGIRPNAPNPKHRKELGLWLTPENHSHSIYRCRLLLLVLLRVPILLAKGL